VEAQTACEMAQWLGMMTWMQEIQQKWDACHEVDTLRGVAIMNMIANTMNGVVQGLFG